MNNTATTHLDDLTSMSRRYGADPEYVLAGGGNTSMKGDGVLYVKGSGTALGAIGPEQFVRMDLEALRATLHKDYPRDDADREAAALADLMAARLPGEEQKRPSVESLLHALFPQRFVLHTHPALVNGLSCAQNGRELLARLLGDGAVWIGLTKPGYILATVCEREFARHRARTGDDPAVVVLQNHGLFVAGDTVEEIDRRMAHVVDTLRAAVTRFPNLEEAPADAAACRTAPALRMLCSPEGRASCVFTAVRELQGMEGEALAALAEPFTPDHIVYCKDNPLFLEPDADVAAAVEAYRARKGYMPKIVVLRGGGFFALGGTRKEALTARDLFLDAVKIAVYSQSFGGPLGLPREFTDFILNWEVEQYRSKVSLAGAARRRLEGKIALVTGAAQGFGRGIAEALAAEGACVAVADLNGDGAKACADALNESFGAHCTVPVRANVADESSVREMVESAVLAFGGLDILVSNAGVLTAGGLDELTKEQFELVTSVNYTGYFLCAKYAAGVMKLQNSYAPGYLTDIIEINSKSGLAGSNKNFAYAGSKFGGIGLTQSFAMELVEHGVKVNAVCPGNLLDGPLWSDPERGLFRQYLDAGKVPGAKTIADVRAHYEAMVPMKRGCTVEDVARAIFYIVEQQYETGQAVPVTGGQVMLR